MQVPPREWLDNVGEGIAPLSLLQRYSIVPNSPSTAGASLILGDGDGASESSLPLSLIERASGPPSGDGWFPVFLRMPLIRVSLPPGEVGVGGSGCGQLRVHAPPGGERVLELPVEEWLREVEPSRSR